MPRVVSDATYERLYRRDNGACRYCAVVLTREQGTVDHFIPRSKGGGDESWNLLLACGTCNRVKDDHEFQHAWKLWDRIGMEIAAAVLETVAPFLRYETCSDPRHFGIEVRWIALPPKPCTLCKSLTQVEAMGTKLHGQRQALAQESRKNAKRKDLRSTRAGSFSRRGR